MTEPGDANLEYERFNLGPGFQLDVLRNAERMVSFDIYHFASVFTYNHGNPQNFGESDGWYGTSTLSDEFLMPAFILHLIRKKLKSIPDGIASYVNRGLDEYVARHRDEYEGTETG